MTKGQCQQGLACLACGKALASLKQARSHVQNKSHQVRQKVHVLYVLPVSYSIASPSIDSLVRDPCIVHVHGKICIRAKVIISLPLTKIHILTRPA